ncbi:MAG: NAD(P)-dependent oxidoreductase [Candidatus Bathyarchaeia archaeon]|jgi:UDP-glucose 4-epimerase
MTSMGVLVTGASGFVGSNILQALVKEGKSAVGYDAAPPPPHLFGKVEVVKGDILDLSRILHLAKQHNIEGAIHTIAIMPSTGSEDMPLQTMKINVGGTLTILEAARLLNFKRVVFCSTVSACGDRGLVKVKESDPSALPFHEIYGLSKFVAEQLCLYYNERFGVDTVIVRFTNVYGPGQRPFRKPFIAGAQPIDWFIHSALSDGTIEMEKGRETRKDYTYIKDVVRGVLLAYEKEKPKYRLYHVSSGKLTTVDEIIKVIKQVLPNISVNIGPGIEEALPYFDMSRAQDDLGYQPQYDIEKAVPDYIDWLRSRASKG